MRGMRSGIYVVVVVLAVGLFFTGKQAKQLQRERVRLESNQTSLLQEQSNYRLRDSLNALSIRGLSLQVSEFKEYFGELNALVKDMGIRVRRVEKVSQNAIESRYDIEAPVVDTIIRVKEADTTSVKLAQRITHRTPHINLEGVVLDSKFYGKITTYDTLTQIVHRVPRRFLFFRFGTKEIRQEIVSSNPHSKIVYSKSIELRKRRRKDR